MWNSRQSGYRADADAVYQLPAGETDDEAGHGGADPLLVDEFLRFVRHGGRTDTSPVAARMAVAAGALATASLRGGGTPREVPPLDPVLVDYFERGQTKKV
ncbi:Gfo/Idh/MocA family oxidoreductase OS=Streptomyces rimosus subsp. rimosus (strain ATCC / DSM 40260 / JCM 4667 / NRRL 2234) OX=1265868 GN=SRIM_035035 PE=4 SV=1 [Streptomyces rimosus subsp. rimosus]